MIDEAWPIFRIVMFGVGILITIISIIGGYYGWTINTPMKLRGNLPTINRPAPYWLNCIWGLYFMVTSFDKNWFKKRSH